MLKSMIWTDQTDEIKEWKQLGADERVHGFLNTEAHFTRTQNWKGNARRFKQQTTVG
jgi:hypothetical protein